MSSKQDDTAGMPAIGSTNNDAAGAALHAMMNGQAVPETPERPAFEPETFAPRTTDLDSLEQKQEELIPEGGEASNQETPSSEVGPDSQSDIDQIELKVKGFKEPVKVPKDFENPQVQELLNKGARFDKVMQETARQRKDLEQKLGKLNDYESKSEVAARVDTAKKLLEQGYHEHALQVIVGESADSLIDTLVEQKIAYQNASPEERLQMDLDKQTRQEQLQRQRDADRIAELEAKIDSRSEQVREAEYAGYIDEAKGRYDLNQWIEDSAVADSLNEIAYSAAMSDVLQLQRSREAKGQENITQRDIRRAFATKAKQLIAHQESTASKLADEKVSQQAEVAQKNAKVASTKNYQNPDVLNDWVKSGGSMSDLVDKMRRGTGGIL